MSAGTIELGSDMSADRRGSAAVVNKSGAQDEYPAARQGWNRAAEEACLSLRMAPKSLTSSPRVPTIQADSSWRRRAKCYVGGMRRCARTSRFVDDFG
jgi:hypothetical protein